MHIFFLLMILFTTPGTVTAAILNRVEVTGNKRTKSEAIIQHGQITTGSELSDIELQKIKENLGRIGQIQFLTIFSIIKMNHYLLRPMGLNFFFGDLLQYQHHLFHRFFLAPFYEYNKIWPKYK